MTVIATKDDVLSKVLMSDSNSLVENFNYASSVAEETAQTTYNIGQVVYWDTDHWRVLKSTDFTTNVLNASTSDVKTAGYPLAVVVGFEGLGKDSFSKVLAANTETDIVVCYQGAVALKEDNLVFDAGVTGASLTAAKVQLRQQNMDLKKVAATVTSSFYGA